MAVVGILSAGHSQGILGRIAVSGTIFGMPFVHLAVFILLKVWRSDTGWVDERYASSVSFPRGVGAQGGRGPRESFTLGGERN